MASPGPADADPELRRVLELLEVALVQARGRGREDLTARLLAERQRALRGSAAVLVVGEFNQGKSSLVNALLNARVCATDADVATAVPTVVRFGEELRVAAGGADDDVRSPVDPDAAEALQTRDDRAAATGPELVEVTVPRALLRDGLVLIDTPGLGGGLASAHAARTLRALTGADAVVFVTDASQELTATEVDLLQRAAGLCPRIVCALTKIDVYPEWRRIGNVDAGHLRNAGLRIPIQPLSSTLRHHGLRTGDRRLVADSGYPRLAAFLRGTAARAGRQGRAAAAAAAHSALSQLVTELATERTALADPGRAAEQIEALREAQRRAEELRSGGSRWLQVLNDRIGDLTSTVDFDLSTRLRAVRKEASERLQTADPTREWVELEPWLYERTNAVLADHLRLLRDEADAVADEVANRFGQEAWRLRADADITRVTGHEVTATGDVGLAALAASRASRVELGIAALRGGSAGAVLAHAVGLLVGALFLPVTLPAAAVLGGILARTTYRSARAAQMRALRAEAERTVAVYLEEVEMRARRDTRDSLRRIHQHLRDVFAGHATELQASVQRDLEAAAAAVREDQFGRQERLRRVDEELTRLRALAAAAGATVDELLAGTRAPAR
jgi:Skp family chaperone for outer membrane proteins